MSPKSKILPKPVQFVVLKRVPKYYTVDLPYSSCNLRRNLCFHSDIPGNHSRWNVAKAVSNLAECGDKWGIPSSYPGRVCESATLYYIIIWGRWTHCTTKSRNPLNSIPWPIVFMPLLRYSSERVYLLLKCFIVFLQA